MQSVQAQAASAESIYQSLVESSRNLHQVVNPAITSNYMSMRLALESAERQAEARNFDAATADLERASAFANRVIKAGS